MKRPEPFQCNIPRGVPCIAREQGIPDRFGVVIGVKWSSATGWWVDVRDPRNIVRSYPAEQVEVLPNES
jgi:hypothetical protein